MQLFTPDALTACAMHLWRFQSAEFNFIEDESSRIPVLHVFRLVFNGTRTKLRAGCTGSRTSSSWSRINSLHRRFKLSTPPLIQTRGFFSSFLRATNLGVGTTSGRDSLCGTEPGGRSDISPHLPLHEKKEGKETGRTWNVFGKPGFQTLSRTKKKVSLTSCPPPGMLRCPQTWAKQAQTEALINKSGLGGWGLLRNRGAELLQLHHWFRFLVNT